MNKALFRGPQFLSVPRPTRMAWSRPAHFLPLMPILALPISDTELLNVSHYGSIAVQIPDGDGMIPTVVLVVHPAFIAPLPFNKDGNWLPPYMPMAMRCLPFTPAIGGGLLYAPLLIEPDASGTMRVEEAPGKPTKEFQQLHEMAQRLHLGAKRLSDAARILIAAKVLVRLETLEETADTQFFIASAERLDALEPQQAAGLTALGMLPLELAAAMLFSQRFLTRRVDLRDRPTPGGARSTLDRRSELFEPLPPDLMAGNFALDGGDLFDFNILARRG
ncbi:MAG: hypothetical protein CFE31_09825 [Rhizobiales bacterium PAR1]|nr:MAG: hypothetical protein CFE31_09825 [Rhizobiales bacterium PAR1]